LPLIRPGQTLRFAMLPDGQDPDDLIKAKGRGAMEEVLGRAIGLVDMVWEREVQAEPLNSPEAKAGLKSRLFAALKEIQHDDVRSQYQTVLLDRFDAEFGRQKKQYGGNNNWNKTPNRKASPALKATMQSGAIEAAREKRLTLLLARHKSG